jgi:hypothetical protein
MIVPELHRKPVPLDREKHRQTRVRLPVQDWSHATGLNALFVTAAEISNVACDHPVVFIKAGQDDKGAVDYAPIAVLGMGAGENLFVEGGRWRGHFMPALLGTYPFCVARVGDDRYAVCIDESWSGLASEGPGDRLFGDDGEPTEFMRRVQGELERLETQIDQTRALGRRLAALDLLRDKRFDATLADGRKLAVDGFLTVDEERLKALPESELLALQRDGVLPLIHAHWVSLGQMRRLLAWRAERPA